MLIENFDVELVDYGFLWGHVFDAAGFDDITWWLFKENRHKHNVSRAIKNELSISYRSIVAYWHWPCYPMPSRWQKNYGIVEQLLKFICRKHEGNLIEMIQQEGFECIGLADLKIHETHDFDEPVLAHTEWLGGSWQSDAQQTIHALREERFDWLIVDHYGLDNRWEKALRPYAKDHGD